MTTEITEYSKTDAALIELRSKYANALFDVTTSKGMQSAKEARAELRGYRVELEKTRKEIKAPALLRCQMIDAEAKRITAALELLEEPIDRQIKSEETRKEAERAERVRQETERLAAIRARIDGIKSIPLSCINKPSSEISAQINEVELIDVSDLTDLELSAAESAKSEAIAALKQMHAERIATETEQARLAAEREELAKREAELRAQREAQERELAEQQAKAKVELDRQLKEQEAAAAAERARVEEEARLRRKQEDTERAARAEQERIEREAKAAAEAEAERLRRAEETRLRAEREEFERQKAAEEKRKRDEAERARLDKIKAGATLLGAAINALRFLIDNNHSDSDVAFELTCAIDKETQQKEAA